MGGFRVADGPVYIILLIQVLCGGLITGLTETSLVHVIFFTLSLKYCRSAGCHLESLFTGP